MIKKIDIKSLIIGILWVSFVCMAVVDTNGSETSVPEPKAGDSGNRSSDSRYMDHGDGTITDTRTDLMWAKKDSYADLGKCQDWNASKSYVNRLTTGGYNDWRLPTLDELKGIFEKSKEHVMGANYEDWRSKYKLSLDSIFADYAAYAYWSSDEAGSCCARSVDFVGGGTRRGARSFCGFYGIRAVRSRQ